ncbi:MAG: 50S ribosomal protein L6 [Planctomycetes bacterium]|nr:50S ribosomal protein L6 [Planctomycetota bacterium]
MSRVGKKPVPVPAGVTVRVEGQTVAVAGPKGTMSWRFPETAQVSLDSGSKAVVVGRVDDRKQSRANHGLTRAYIANMVRGVSTGFQKALQIYGTGYNCKLQGRTLHLNVGFSGRRRGVGAQFELSVPEGVEVVVEREAARGDNEPAQLLIRGFDKQRVGQFAAEVRAIRRTEPYKGKGIRYTGEHVRRKQGKALTSGG